MSKRIAFVGAGAIGGYIGANLAALGHDVTLIDPWPAHVEAIRSGGMDLYGMTEAGEITPSESTRCISPKHSNLAKQRPIDIAFVSVKSYDTVWATRLIRQYLSPGGFVVSCRIASMRNALPAWSAGAARLAASSLAVSAWNCLNRVMFAAAMPKKSECHVVPRRRTAWPHHAAGRGTRRDAGRHRHGPATDNLWGERWTKLCVNGMRNGVSAATGHGRQCARRP